MACAVQIQRKKQGVEPHALARWPWPLAPPECRLLGPPQPPVRGEEGGLSRKRGICAGPFPRLCPRSGVQQNLRTPPPPRRARDWCCYRANGTHDGWKRGICATILPKAGPEVRVATEPAHTTFPEQSSRSVVLQGVWHHRCLDMTCCGRFGRPVLPPGTAPAPPEE